jgi:thiol-disulfide isomerase/thioredoxin
MAAAESSPKANLATVLTRVSFSDHNGAARSLSGKKAKRLLLNNVLDLLLMFSSRWQILMFYFSAHWCPPCRSFTPLLSKFYKRHAASKDFEIIFVSNDKDEAEFNAYFASM